MISMDDETFARLYSAQYASFDEDLPLWRALAEEHGSPVLEIGCGAGRVLRTLAEAGAVVTGIDTSPAMLRRAQQALARLPAERVKLIECDVRRLALDQRFRLILSPCNTLAALDDDSMQAALRRVHAHLLPGGALAFEVPGPGEEPEEMEAEAPLAAFIEGQSGHPVQVSAAQHFDGSSGRAVVTWRYDELHPDGTVQAWTLTVPFHLRPPEAYAGLLERAGLRLTALYGDYDRRRVAPLDTRLIVVGVRDD